MPDRDPGFLLPMVVSVHHGGVTRLAELCARLAIKRPAVLIDPALVEGPVGSAVRAQLEHSVFLPTDSGEPSIVTVARAAKWLRDVSPDGVIAVGGGSTLDTAKLARGLLAARAESVRELPDAFPEPPLPLIAIPTTAGTGAEAGAGALVFDPDIGSKTLIRRTGLAPQAVIADSDLTLTLPASLTAYTGLDALAQAILAYVAAGQDAISGQLALRAIGLIFAHLPSAVRDGLDRDARAGMMLGSVMSGIAMFNAPPTYAGEHIFAEPVGAALRLNHGHCVAAFLPGTAQFNLPALGKPFGEIAREVRLVDASVPDNTAANRFVAALRELVNELAVKPLKDTVQSFDLQDLAARCRRHDGYQLNPRPIPPDDAVAILRGGFTGSFRVEPA